MKMKRHLAKSIGLLFAASLVSMSCLPLLPSGAKSGVSGAVTIRVRPVSAQVQEAFLAMHRKEAATARSLEPKVLVGAGLVKFSVVDSTTGGIADSWAMSPSQSTVGSVDFQDSRMLPQGDYTLYARVFTSASDTTPSVTGSATFHVTAGQTAGANLVSVTCFPYSPVDVVQGTASATKTLAQAWNVTPSGVVYSIGSEHWFRVTPTTPFTDFSAIPETTGSDAASIILLLFDKNGAYLTYAGNAGPGTTSLLSGYATTSGDLYYLAAINVNGAALPTSSYHILYVPYVAPPQPLPSFGQYHQYSLAPNQVLWFKFDAIQDHQYVVNWDDDFRGSGNYSADIWVEAYRADKTTKYTFSTNDHGWKADYYYCYGSYYAIPVDDTQHLAAVDNVVYLKVREYSPGSTYGSFALKVADATAGNQAPYIPQLDAPYDNSSNLTPANVDFSWTSNGDPNGDAVTFKLSARYSTDGGVTYSGWTALYTGSNDWAMIPTLTPNASYEWYVEASDGSLSSSSAHRFFSTNDGTATVHVQVN
jgi:hypothetical protein